MRISKMLIPTTKEVPAEAETLSHQLMLRAGYMLKVASGIYEFLPLASRVLERVIRIIREEMNAAGAQEVLMPILSPAELWQESGRWSLYGKEMMRLKDRHEHDYCLGPTHEEVITDMVRRTVRSYKELPVNLYQIQLKFRDEVRPRFGVMRAKEFMMKDAYSFDRDEAGAEASYKVMLDAYARIFDRCGFNFKTVEADSGLIGGSFSHEFMVMAETGEEEIVSCTGCSYAANMEKAEGKLVKPAAGAPQPLQKVHTPNIRTVEELENFLKKKPHEMAKTILYQAGDKVAAVLMRGDQEINEVKLKNKLGVSEVTLASPETIYKHTGAPVGFAGPLNLKVELLADLSVEGLTNLVCGGNEKDYHYINVNPGRDFQVAGYADLRKVKAADLCPRCGKILETKRGIEVGHCFKLGTKYSKSMKANFLDQDGKEKPFVMGCYGIGVSRIMAAAIEQSHDEHGIIWPQALAPFEVVMVLANVSDEGQKSAAEKIYQDLLAKGCDVLLDDRDERAGVKFKDADLIGIPWRITVGKSLLEGMVEIKKRSEKDPLKVKVDDCVKTMMEKLGKKAQG